MPAHRYAIKDGKKHCNGCDKWLPVEAFHRARRQTTGLQARCKKCGAASDIEEPSEIRFWSRVNRGSEDECWTWKKGRHSGGYGVFTPRGEPVRFAHRMAWELTNGPIPAGLFVCHRCDNPPCCNPAHLFLGTAQDNVHDMMSKGRHRVSPSRGELRWNTTLTDDDVRKIRTRLARGERGAALAREFGVSPQVICRINRGKTWSHVA